MPHPPTLARGLLDWPQRYWQGETSSLGAVVAVMLGGRLAMGLCWSLVTYPIPWLFFYLLGAADSALLFWQVIGGWRCLSTRFDRVADRLLLLSAHLAVMILTFVTLFSWLDHLASQAPAPPWSEISVSPLPVSEQTAILDGPIDFRALQSFDATPADSFATLRLDSPGGLVYAARALAQRVAERGLTTEVLGDCLSACTLVFLAAEKRRLGETARLGFHSYAELTTVPLLDIPEQQARDRAFLEDRGLATDFLNRIAETPPTEMWFPDRETLVAAGVLPR